MTISEQPVVAMIHLPPLPGAGNYDGQPVRALIEHAVEEAALLARAGYRWLLVQNTHDAPTRATVPIASLTAMAAIGAHVRQAFPGELGINVHKNDGPGALQVAHAIGATFIRVKVLVGAWVGPEGVLEGNAAEVSAVRRELGSEVEVWADLGELTSVPLASVERATLADWAGRFGGADRLIVTGTDLDTSLAMVEQARSGTAKPVLIGGRTTPATVQQALAASDGVIVGSCLRAGGRTTGPLIEEQVTAYLTAARPG